MILFAGQPLLPWLAPVIPARGRFEHAGDRRIDQGFRVGVDPGRPLRSETGAQLRVLKAARGYGYVLRVVTERGHRHAGLVEDLAAGVLDGLGIAVVLGHEVAWRVGLHPKLNPWLHLFPLHQAGDLADLVEGRVRTTDNNDVYRLRSIRAGRWRKVIQVVVHLNDLIHRYFVTFRFLGHLAFEGGFQRRRFRRNTHQVQDRV